MASGTKIQVMTEKYNTKTKKKGTEVLYYYYFLRIKGLINRIQQSANSGNGPKTNNHVLSYLHIMCLSAMLG